MADPTTSSTYSQWNFDNIALAAQLIAQDESSVRKLNDKLSELGLENVPQVASREIKMLLNPENPQNALESALCRQLNQKLTLLPPDDTLTRTIAQATTVLLLNRIYAYTGCENGEEYQQAELRVKKVALSSLQQVNWDSLLGAGRELIEYLLNNAMYALEMKQKKQILDEVFAQFLAQPEKFNEFRTILHASKEEFELIVPQIIKQVRDQFQKELDAMERNYRTLPAGKQKDGQKAVIDGLKTNPENFSVFIGLIIEETMQEENKKFNSMGTNAVEKLISAILSAIVDGYLRIDANKKFKELNEQFVSEQQAASHQTSPSSATSSSDYDEAQSQKQPRLESTKPFSTLENFHFVVDTLTYLEDASTKKTAPKPFIFEGVSASEIRQVKLARSSDDRQIQVAFEDSIKHMQEKICRAAEALRQK